MKLDLRKAVNIPGAELPFEFTMDFSRLEHNGLRPAPSPVSVWGRVVNIAGVLNLQMKLRAELELMCDRCLKRFSSLKEVSVDHVVADEAEDEDDEIILIGPDDCIDLAEIAETAFILSLDSKTLCRDDCRGLCSRCGADLNLGDCGCQKEGDPRLAIFRELLNEQ